MILLDTNVLVSALNADVPAFASCRDVVERAMSGRLDAVLVPQVLTEFYAVVTSPRRTTRPVTAADAMARIIDWRSTVTVRYPTAPCLDELVVLAQRVPRSGQAVHDLFLAAQMRAHGVTDICTLNARDFAELPGIAVRSPESV